MSTRSVASWYFRSLTQAFSMFFASWANTKARLLEGGVKVFTFWMVWRASCSPVTSSKI